MYALALLGLPLLSRGRRGTWCTAGGLMYALALLVSAVLPCFRVAGVGLGALQGV